MKLFQLVGVGSFVYPLAIYLQSEDIQTVTLMGASTIFAFAAAASYSLLFLSRRCVL